ncbi:hypothetical protein Acr_24g0009850 [Actinidia rufa]|uniref:Uncharacterized protein n=1 Tax=Actinidia rufa TaxID=165716 RepID=A0A7J0GVB9_9ERIC|nr:hypothetical protein Acr_24g0009850 [Actinidia rufa]
MDEQSNSDDANSHSGGQQLETSKAERAIWLMKCPPVVSRSLQCPPPSSEFASLFDSCRPVAKVVVSIDPSALTTSPLLRYPHSFPPFLGFSSAFLSLHALDFESKSLFLVCTDV